MKVAWTVLIISAFTDFVITGGGMLMSSLVTMATPDWPPRYVFLMSFIGGFIAAARTVQQALKLTPEAQAALKGAPSITTTTSTTTTGG